MNEAKITISIFPILKSIVEIIKKVRVNMVLGDAVSKSETFVHGFSTIIRFV